MKTARPLRRSVSPFGAPTRPPDEFDNLKDIIHSVLSDKKDKKSETLDTFDDILNLPDVMRSVCDAPANEASQLTPLCQYLLRYKLELQENEIFEEIYKSMAHIFDRKTEFFLVDHHDEDFCKKMEWPEKYRDGVLFSKERNSLVTGFFDPVSQKQPGIFSKFINKWSETQNIDRMLHFLDFFAESKKSTFEHALIFSHPALSRILRDKKILKSLFLKAHPLLIKLSSPTWEQDTRNALEVTV